jgi:competence ComEA-like helix-hairpin-helix protein
MGLYSRIQSQLGMTTSDATVAFFIAFTALGGFFYTTFFDSRTELGPRRSLLLIEQRHDSLMKARELSQRKPLQTPDSATQWTPQLQADTVRDVLSDDVLIPAPDVPQTGVAESHELAGSTKELPTSAININSAEKSILMQLPGVGEKTADAIIAYRLQTPFQQPEDLMNVKGIGEKKFEKMKDYVIVK